MRQRSFPAPRSDALLLPSRSIRIKLAWLIVASVGAAVLLSFVIGSLRELDRFAEAKRAEMEATAHVMAASAATAVAQDDRAATQQVLNAISRLPEVHFAEVLMSDGTTMVEAGTGVSLVSIDRVRDAGDPSLWRMLRKGDFYVSTDIVKGGERVGSLGLLVDSSELLHRLLQALGAAAIGAAAAIGIGLLIAARLQRSITNPLSDLARTMNAVRVTSDFTQRAQRHSDDETGQLVEAFNDMLDQIGSRDRALEEHRAGLERTVSERTRQLADARDVAESANRAKSDFLATMSHEIRTPMNGMLVMAELLAGTQLPMRQQRYAETIVRSGQTLLTIINDILDISKIEAGKLELEQGRVVLATVVEDVLGLFWEKASSKQLDLAAFIASDVPEVIEADPVRLSQILSNLVNNALKFTQTGHVKVAIEVTERDGDTVRLAFAVEDTGIGIPADKVDTIFEAFSQADQSTTRRFGGTGLGLSICQRLVSAMGGRIWAQSTPGLGSQFRFTLAAPVLEAAGAPMAATSGTAVIALDGGATRDVLAEVLTAAGYALSDPTAAALAKADVVFANTRTLDAMPQRAAAEQTTICVAGVGNGRVDRLLAEKRIDGVLARPVSSPRARDVLAAIAAGDVASLLDGTLAERSPDLPDLAGISVLVADDSPVNREVVTEALSRLKARAQSVENGIQALEAFRHGDFDLVLMDCSMPEMDGFAATRAVRALEASQQRSRIPVVALTAHVAGGAGDSWREAGMDDYLTKPFTMRSLADCLARLLPEAGSGRQVTPPSPAADDAPAAADARPGAPLDPDVVGSLRAIANGNSAVLERIFRLFEAHAPARFAALETAFADNDQQRIASEAHALKSPSLNIGALRLGEMCARLEAAARSGGDTRPDARVLQEIGAELAAVQAAIVAETGAAPARASA